MISPTPEVSNLVILLSEVETKTRIPIEPVVFLAVLVSLMLEVFISITPIFEFETKIDDVGAEVETKNNAKFRTGNMGYGIVRINSTISFKGKFSARADDMDFSVLGTKVTARL